MHNISDKILSGFLTLSMLIGLSSCEVEFTPDITPLVIGPLSPDQPFEEIPEQESEFTLPTDGVSKVFPGLTSNMVIDLCSEHLSWGDEVFGMCIAPNGEYYFFWRTPDEVNIVQVNPQDPSQAGFREAVQERSDMIDDTWQTTKKSVPRIGSFFLSLLGLPFACSTVFLCALDGAAVLTTAGLIADSGDSIANNFGSINVAEKRARYYACLLKGDGELTCREEAGIEDFTGE